MVAQGKHAEGVRNPGACRRWNPPPRPGLSAAALAKVERAAAETLQSALEGRREIIMNYEL